MGVNGLLPILKSIVKHRHISEYKGQKIAIDGYCWLHRGAFGCAQDLCEGRETTKYVDYCMSKVEMLLHYGVKPLLVFDGAELPLKLSEENERDRSRKENLERALCHKREGNVEAALKCYQRAVDVTPKMAKKFIDALEKANIEFVVAPYEADAQMAYFAINNYVQAVITEDSDLLAYGCPKVLYKFKNGDCQEICIADLPKNTSVVFKGFTQDMFVQMCILAGCDFLKALPRIGIRKAHSHINGLVSFTKVINKLRMSGTSIPEDYHIKFQRVIWLFRHQRVFCLKEKKLVHLRPLPKGGQLCPITKKPFSEIQDRDENVNCEIIQCVKPISRSIRANGLRPLRKTTVTNLHQYFPTKQTTEDEKESVKSASNTIETTNTSSKTSIQSTEPSVQDTSKTSDLSDNKTTEESVKDSCEEKNDGEPREKKRQRLQSPMSTEIITGLDSGESKSSTECASTDNSKDSVDKQDQLKTPPPTPENTSNIEENKKKEEEAQPESKTRSSIKEVAKAGNKKFHSISHITYYARMAKAALGKVHKHIMNKEDNNNDEEEGNDEVAPPMKNYADHFNEFASKHLKNKKKRAFDRIQ
eukprot:g7743.t1